MIVVAVALLSKEYCERYDKFIITIIIIVLLFLYNNSGLNDTTSIDDSSGFVDDGTTCI